MCSGYLTLSLQDLSWSFSQVGVITYSYLQLHSRTCTKKARHDEAEAEKHEVCSLVSVLQHEVCSYLLLFCFCFSKSNKKQLCQD